MFFKTKKSAEIYGLKIAHRGIHSKFPENTIKAYSEAIDKGYAIELDIRFTKDNKIICFHDRYTKRLLGIKGKIFNKTYKELNTLYIKMSYERVPLLIDVLKLVGGKVALLIEVKGLLSLKHLEILLEVLSDYKGTVYFHVKNIFTYLILRKKFPSNTFYILNPIRKRFDFIKTKK